MIELKDRTWTPAIINKTKAEELKKAMKTDSNGVPVTFHWKNEEAKEFIDFIVNESAGLLAKFRNIQMTWPTKEIAKIVDDWKFLKPGGSYKRTYWNSGDNGYEFSFESITLKAEKVEGMFFISDDELDDNIEWTKWETHIKQIVAKKIANELVEVAIYWRKLDRPSPVNGILNVYDWVRYLCEKYGNVIDADWAEITRKIIIKAKKVLKTKYRKDVELFMDSDIKTDLDELYNDPNGRRWDGEIIKNSVSGMNINEVPLMSAENAVINKAVTTKIQGTVSVWDKTINVTSDLTSSLSNGDFIVVKAGKADEMVYTVNTVTANQITIKEKVVYELSVNDTIHKAELKWADVIITNPKNIIIWTQRDIIVEFERLAPDWFKIWYKLKQDIKIENPESIVLIKNLKSKDL